MARFCICGAMVSDGLRCAKCSTTTARGLTTKARGYDYEWQQCRSRYLDDHPCCEDCQEKGVTRPAEHVHHITPISEARALRLEPSNLAALCVPCHEARHGRKLKWAN